MKKYVFLALLSGLLIFGCPGSEASFVSNTKYAAAQAKAEKQDIKLIKSLFKTHTNYANSHDIKGLRTLYHDNYVNNDGFDKQVYFKNIEDTWEVCKDLTYTTKILSIDVNGDYATVATIETATGTMYDSSEYSSVAGELHSKSSGLYHLRKINSNWFIDGETALSDESSLLYGDARFMDIELEAPSQVNMGDDYTATLKINSQPDMYIIASIERDLVTYPSNTPKGTLRPVPQSGILERVIKANGDNLNEYSVASLAISKAKSIGNSGYQVYMTGLACVMKRVNVVPKNNYIKLEEENEDVDR